MADFSWKIALRTWLGGFTIGAVLFCICRILERLPQSKGSGSILQFFVGLGGALLEIAATFPLAELAGGQQTDFIPMIIPNCTLWGLVFGVVAGFFYPRSVHWRR
jgi:hypothetical protein